MSKPTLASLVADYGEAVKAKLTSPTATGEPEEQLRSPLEELIQGIAGLFRFRRGDVVAVGETSLADLKVRPDFAVNVRKALVGFVEVKAPGKGSDPRAFKGHDKEQWQKLQSLPNLLYTDGESFSLWRNGEIEGKIVSLGGDLRKAGRKLTASTELLVLFESFLRWAPTPPRNVKELAKVTARLCRLLRDEVTEQLGMGCEALTSLAANWRDLLFPEATDEQFADGYAQAVTFGLLMARARGILIGRDLDKVGKELGKTSTLIGAALRVLTDDAESERALQTSLGTLTRVLDAVNWSTISKGKHDAWLYFYEDFLEEYDNALRKKTGSYYTPPEVVEPMVRLVDEVVRTRFGRPAGLAAPEVTIADPALGTGTFVLQALRHIATTVENDQGAGAVQPAIDAAMNRIIGFEYQLGPFAVAQLRIQAELLALGLTAPATPMKMYVADTLANPWHDDPRVVLPSVKPIAEQRRTANKIKRETPITVVLGNPPYKEKAMGRGGWVESVERTDGSAPTIEEKLTGRTKPILEDWLKVHGWSAGAHGKHLRNLYVYFWRWATWKVFDQSKEHNTGIVSFITVSGFLTGPGFQMMREYFRKTANDVWVINCSPEGHQPDVADRIFQGVQQPVCIVMVSRSEAKSSDIGALVRYVSLPVGKRQEKFDALSKLTLGSPDWKLCPAEFRAPFMPEVVGDWKTYPMLDELFGYNGSGTQAKRTWVIAPDEETLKSRWDRLINWA
jgi:N-6 DNA Methylase